jgi:hypothetical protein
MKLTRTDVEALTPRLVRVRRGWLAVTAPGSPLPIGVQAETEEEARSRFHDLREAWALLMEEN